MIELPEVITAGGNTTLVFELTDAAGNRLSNLGAGIARVSLRKASTRRDMHEVPRRRAGFDAEAATVTLALTTAETAALGPPHDNARASFNRVIGDVEIDGVDGTFYYGPFAFTVRSAETHLGDEHGVASQVTEFTITDRGSEMVSVTLTIANVDPADTVYVRYRVVGQTPWSDTLSMPTLTESVTFDLTDLRPATLYFVQASFSEHFLEGVEQTSFQTQLPIPVTRYGYVTTPYTIADNPNIPIPTAAEILADGRATDSTTRIFFPNPGVSGYPWIFFPTELQHLSLNSIAGFDQRGGFPFVQMININGHDYFAYVNRAGLASFAFDRAWYAY